MAMYKVISVFPIMKSLIALVSGSEKGCVLGQVSLHGVVPPSSAKAQPGRNERARIEISRAELIRTSPVEIKVPVGIGADAAGAGVGAARLSPVAILQV
jgi:hypothetical protein